MLPHNVSRAKTIMTWSMNLTQRQEQPKKAETKTIEATVTFEIITKKLLKVLDFKQWQQ